MCVCRCTQLAEFAITHEGKTSASLSLFHHLMHLTFSHIFFFLPCENCYSSVLKYSHGCNMVEVVLFEEYFMYLAVLVT